MVDGVRAPDGGEGRIDAGLKAVLDSRGVGAVRESGRRDLPPTSRMQAERMARTLGVVEAGHRAPAAMMRRLAGRTVLEWVVRRVTDCQRLDAVVVIPAEGVGESFLAELVPPNVPVFGGGRDPLGRYLAAAAQHQADAIIRVPADRPLVDPELIDRLAITAGEHPECHYISFCARDGRPAVVSPLGVCAEWCSVAALEEADREARGAEREDGLVYIRSRPERFTMRLVRLPAELDEAVWRPEGQDELDWEHVQTIFDAVGPDGWDARQMASLFGTGLPG